MLDFLSDLIVTKIRSVHTMYTEKSPKTKRYNRPCWALLYKYEGETVYASGGKTYISNKSCMYLLPKGSNYEWRCTEAGHFCTIEFDCNKSYPEILRFPVTDGDRILETIKSLEYKRTVKTPLYEMESIQTLYSLLLKLLTSEKSYIPSEKQRKLKPAADYIATHYTEHLTNDILAAQTGLSTVYFRKLFCEVYGQSPMAYVQNLRIRKAKELLTGDFAGITEIAQMLGYSGIYDFSRSFKKHTGVSPSAYAKKRI